MGDPVRMRRCGVRKRLHSWVISASALRILCPSSSTTYSHRRPRSSCAHFRTISYEVTSTEQPPHRRLVLGHEAVSQPGGEGGTGANGGCEGGFDG